MIRGDAMATAVYDTGANPVNGGVVLVLHHDDKPVLTIELPHGATGEHQATCSPLPLRKGVNVLRLVTSVYGGPAPTRALLRITTTDGKVVIDCRFDTSGDVSNIDQSWQIVRA
jgi:hypothetical protein